MTPNRRKRRCLALSAFGCRR